MPDAGTKMTVNLPINCSISNQVWLHELKGTRKSG
jgi:hypothetical protein